MFSKQEKEEIAQKVEEIILSYHHPEMPAIKPKFELHIDGAESWSWADIEPNWKFKDVEPGTNPWNEKDRTALALAIKKIEKDKKSSSVLVTLPFSMIWLDIMRERERQDAKFGRQEYFSPIWFLILAEEVGEVAKALLHTIFGGPEKGKVREELVQVAAVAIAWLEAISEKRALIQDLNGDIVEEKGG